MCASRLDLCCRFLTVCQQYNLLSSDVKAIASLDGETVLLDPNSRRTHKVQRFKREREIKSQLAANQMKKMRLHQLQAEVGIAMLVHVIADTCHDQNLVCCTSSPHVRGARQFCICFLVTQRREVHAIHLLSPAVLRICIFMAHTHCMLWCSFT